MGWKSAFLVCAALGSALSATNPCEAAGNDTIKSVVAAISSANGQARLELVKGIYKTSSAGSDFTFEVPQDMSSTLKFNYSNRSIQYGSWAFQKSIFVQIRSGSKCVRLEVKRFEYGEGGFLGDSDQEIVPNGPCRESEPLSHLNTFLRMSPVAGDLFRGSAFIGHASLKKCADKDCRSYEAGVPIRRATFYSANSRDDTPLPGLGIKFRAGSRIILPKSGFLEIAANSEALFDDLTYDLQADTGDALLSKFKVTLNDGIISADTTILRIKPASELVLSEFRIQKDTGSVKIEGGGLSGQLGEGTSIVLTRDDLKASSLAISSANVSLAGISYSGVGSDASLFIKRGRLSVFLDQAEIWFSDKNSIRLGYSGLNLALGCADAAPLDTCAPLGWNREGVRMAGTITAFRTALTGGQFNVSDVGLVRLSSGKIEADNLTIDTSDRRSPITGKVNVFEVSLEGQNLHIDEANIIGIAKADVKAYDIVYKKGQSLPIGSVNLSGSANKIEGGEVGKFKFEAGAKFDLRIDRRDGDEPEVMSGTLDGQAKALMSEGNTATVSILLDRIRYYRGHGEAKVRLIGREASYAFHTPSARDSRSLTLIKAETELKSITLIPALAEPIIIDTRIISSNKKWSIDPVVGVPFKLRIPISAQELVYSRIRPAVGNGTICAPKVNLAGQSPTISGKIDVFAANSGGKLRIYDNALSAGVEAEVDDRGCQEIADGVCYLVGSAFGGPIGGAALAMMCDAKLDEAKEKLSNTIRDESTKKVAESRFSFDF